MLKFELMKDVGVPVVINNAKSQPVKCLLSTGIDFPIWNGDVAKFIELYPEAELLDTVTVFGTQPKVTHCPVYHIPEFVLSNNGYSMTFMNVYVTINMFPADYEMALNYNMFGNCALSFNQKDSLLTIYHNPSCVYCEPKIRHADVMVGLSSADSTVPWNSEEGWKTLSVDERITGILEEISLEEGNDLTKFLQYCKDMLPNPEHVATLDYDALKDLVKVAMACMSD